MFFIGFLLLNLHLKGQEKFERFTINFGGTIQVFKSPNGMDRPIIVPQAEFLLNLPVSKTSQLLTGINIESGKHVILEDEAYLIYVNDKIGWVPYEGRNYWNLNFLTLKVPVYFSGSLNDFFLDAYTFGVGAGWLSMYKLTEEQMPDTSHEKINRSFLDFSFGVQKDLLHFNTTSLGLTPAIGYRVYLTDHNDWQKKFFFGQLKFNVNF